MNHVVIFRNCGVKLQKAICPKIREILSLTRELCVMPKQISEGWVREGHLLTTRGQIRNTE